MVGVVSIDLGGWRLSESLLASSGWTRCLGRCRTRENYGGGRCWPALAGTSCQVLVQER